MRLIRYPSKKIQNRRLRPDAGGSIPSNPTRAPSSTHNPDRTGTVSVSRDPLTIEVEATNYNSDHLKYVVASIEDAVSTIAGWAETKRCIECEQPVALLFDDAYLETQNDEGVIRCECYRRTEDS
jgi:hypothetical protein